MRAHWRNHSCRQTTRRLDCCSWFLTSCSTVVEPHQSHDHTASSSRGNFPNVSTKISHDVPSAHDRPIILVAPFGTDHGYFKRCRLCRLCRLWPSTAAAGRPLTEPRIVVQPTAAAKVTGHGNRSPAADWSLRRQI